MLQRPKSCPSPITLYSKTTKKRGELYKCKALFLKNIRLQNAQKFLQEFSHLTPETITIHNPFEFDDPEELKSFCRLILKMRRLRAIDVSSEGSSEISSLFITLLQKVRKIKRIKFDLSKTFLSRDSTIALLRSLSKKKYLLELKATFDLSKCQPGLLLGELSETLMNLKHIKSLKIFLEGFERELLEQLNPILISTQRLVNLRLLDLNLDKCSLDNFSLKILMRSLEYLLKIKILKMNLILRDESYGDIEGYIPHISNLKFIKHYDLSLRCEENSYPLLSQLMKKSDKITNLKLDFEGTQIKDQELIALSSDLGNLKKLKKFQIDLTACNLISTRGLCELFNFIGTLIELEDLSFILYKFYNPDIFGDTSMKALQNSFLNLNQLKGLSLYFGRSNVKDCTYAAISNILNNYSGFMRLDFSIENSRNLTEHRFVDILEGIKKQPLLEDLKLTLQCFELEDKTLSVLADCINLSPAITKFEAKLPYHTNLTSFNLSRFRTKLQNNKKLKKLMIIESQRAPVKTHQNYDLIMIILINLVVLPIIYHSIF